MNIDRKNQNCMILLPDVNGADYRLPWFDSKVEGKKMDETFTSRQIKNNYY